jgi:L,D-transpeptidase ErfK/SrfK
MRMYPKDVEQLFQTVSVGTLVRIVNQPYKVGVAHNNIYLEVHPHLAEDNDKFRDQFSHVVELIVAKTAGLDVQLNWRLLRNTIVEKSGMPTAVGALRAYPATTAQPFGVSASGAVANLRP